jgi:hypothetical protein
VAYLGAGFSRGDHPATQAILLGVVRNKIENIYVEEKKENEALGNCNPQVCKPAIILEE